MGSFNPNGGSATGQLQFKEHSLASDLSCSNITDKFSVSNNKAQLVYKVGLASASELNLLNQNNARKTGQNYRILSPYYYISASAYSYYMSSTGSFGTVVMNSAYGVRPTISLIPGMRYSSGDGSMANPYVVDTGS